MTTHEWTIYISGMISGSAVVVGTIAVYWILRHTPSK